MSFRKQQIISNISKLEQEKIPLLLEIQESFVNSSIGHGYVMSEDKHERVKEKIAKLNKQITKLKEELEDLNKIRHGMNLEQIFLEVVEISKSIRIDVDGFDDPYLEAQIYASICQRMQVTWAYNQPWLQHWKEQAAMFPNNEKITDRLQASESKDETVQSIWIAADKAYHNAVNRIQGDFDPPLQYWRSNNRVLTEAFERHKQRNVARNADKLIKVQNDIDSNYRKLFADHMGARPSPLY
jgi:hypothetical protein